MWRRINLFFLLAFFEGVLAFFWFTGSTPEAAGVFLFGMSRSRLALAGLIILPGLLFLALTYCPAAPPGWRIRLWDRVDAWLSQAHGLLSTVISLAIAALLGLALIVWELAVSRQSLEFYYEWLGSNFSLLHSLIKQALPLIAWAVVLAAQSLGWIWFHYRGVFRTGRVWSWRVAAWTLLAWVGGVVTLIHWVSLALSLTTFTSIPGWHWTLSTKPITARHGLFVFLILLSVLLLGWILRRPKLTWRGLLLICLLGYAVQIGVGVVDGKGIESLREKYYGTLHRSYTNKAAAGDDSVLESIRSYESVYSNMLFPSTKPPGVMAIYIGMERTINSFTHKESFEERFDQLSKFVAIVFPVLSMAAVLILGWYVARFLFPAQPDTGVAALLAPLWFILAPDIVLLPLFLDQAFYPSLFMLATVPAFLAFQKQKWILALLAGIALYVAIFFSFSLLPIFAFPVFYAALLGWMDLKRPLASNKKTLARQLFLLACLAAGVIGAFGLFRAALNYDFFARYANAMSVVYDYDFYSRVGLAPGAPISMGLRVSQILEALALNNLDFASLVGFPIFILFLVRGVKTLFGVLRRTAERGEIVQATFFLCFLALNVIGQMRGEAGRLWMYWVPVVVGLAAVEAAPLLRRRPALAYGLLAAQWITLILTYQFQDLIF